jgi:hypothetical protein
MPHGGTRPLPPLELVPERRLVFAILTNHADGWRLIRTSARP